MIRIYSFNKFIYMMDEERFQNLKLQSYQDLKSKKMTYQNKPEAITLSNKPKYMYPQFNLFLLELNRLSNLPEYKILANQITMFNKQLDDWKKKNIEVKNIFVTYHLYQNLYSRMKFTSNLVIDRKEAKRAYIQMAKWFFQEKPKIRNKAPEKQEGKMKPSTADSESESGIERLLTTNQTKRQLKVYQTMSRTVHSEFFPPKERLLDYKRKQIVQTANHEALNPRRAASVTNLGKIQKYSGSFASTVASFKRTVVTQLKREQSKIQPIVIPFEIKQSQLKEELNQMEKIMQAAEDLEKEKLVIQQQILRQNISQPVHEEDVQEAQQEIHSQQDQDIIKYKKYKEDPNTDFQIIAEQNIKDIKQSTLRRILKQKEESIRQKMQQLNIAKQMSNWGAIKGRANSQNHQMSQRRLLVNKFIQMEFHPKTFEERQQIRKREIPQYQFFHRTKSSNALPAQNQLQKYKIAEALKLYGKYINHVQIRPTSVEAEQKMEEIKKFRATSLTSFSTQSKKKFFSKILQENGTHRHNEDAQDYVLVAKDRLAKKGISVQKQNLLNALAITDMDKIQKKQPFPFQAKLFSNPFFPKHLYGAKAKKKKK